MRRALSLEWHERSHRLPHLRPSIATGLPIADAIISEIDVVLPLATGLMVCAATIVNMVIRIKIVAQKSTEDPLQLWAIIEMNVGLICVCLPAMEQLLARSIPFFSKKYGNGGSYGSSMRKKSVPNGDIVTPGGRKRSIFDREADAESTTSIRLTHEMKQFDEQNESMPDDSAANGNNYGMPEYVSHFTDIGERPHHSVQLRD